MNKCALIIGFGFCLAHAGGGQSKSKEARAVVIQSASVSQSAVVIPPPVYDGPSSFACGVFALNAGGSVSKAKEASYKPLMKSILSLKHDDISGDQHLTALTELFGGDGYGGKSRWGGIIHLDGKIYANNLGSLILDCGYLSKEVMASLLNDLEKNRDGILKFPFYVPRYGWTTSTLGRERINSLLQVCSEREESDALLVMREFLNKQSILVLEVESYKQSQSQTRVDEVSRLLQTK